MAFFNNTQDGGWVSDGNWTVAGGSLINLVQPMPILNHPGLGVSGSFTTIELTYTVDQYPATSSLRVVITDAFLNQAVCHVNGEDSSFSVFLDGSPESLLIGTTTQRLTLNTDLTSASCAVVPTTTVPATLSSTTTVASAPVDIQLLVINQLQVSINDIIIYQYVAM